MTSSISSLLLATALLISGPAGASSALQGLNIADCGFTKQEEGSWHPSRLLDVAVERWAHGGVLHEAVERSGYRATAVSGLHIYGLDAPERPHLSAANCRVLRDRSLQDVGVYRRGDELWILLAARVAPPTPEVAKAMVRRALVLVNEAREQGHRCSGSRRPPVGTVSLSAILSKVADQHARDMAAHHYLDHVDSAGRSPADRVKLSGYAEQLVGENIAYGPLSAEEAIAGWLKSPEHCENLMDPRFKEMGIDFAEGRGAQHGLYWVQLLADPK